jgi:hypothetical protein
MVALDLITECAGFAGMGLKIWIAPKIAGITKRINLTA